MKQNIQETKEKIIKALENKEKKQVTDYFIGWDGWYCEVADEEDYECGEVIGCDTSSLMEHLKEKHKIDVEL